MENRSFVDQQRPRKVLQFLAQYGTQLARQGAVVPTWRRRDGRKLGPYYLLVCRDPDGRQRSVYLGPEGDLVEQTRDTLVQLQAPLVEQRYLAQVHQQLRVGLVEAKHQLDHELQQFGLSRKGSEIRGWSRVKCVSLDRPSQEIGDLVRQADR